MSDGGVALSDLQAAISGRNRRSDKRSAIRHIDSKCRMAALPYPTYRLRYQDVTVGLISAAPSDISAQNAGWRRCLIRPTGCDIGRNRRSDKRSAIRHIGAKRRMAALPYPTYRLRYQDETVGLISAAPSDISAQHVGWRCCLIRPTGCDIRT